ncbi:MAG TPA: hypothetical protein VMA36_17160 [Candidatus Limnocylindria bacterium]|jgi:hypothetical protein|nr:hypothetical protein [Candidatus Limnocylindria bacterium]
MIPVLLSVVMAVAVAPSPSPNPDPLASLPSIGSVKARTVCTRVAAVYDHAAQLSRTNDAAIVSLSDTRKLDFDNMMLPKQTFLLNKYANIATRLREQAEDGQADVDKIHAIANSLPDIGDQSKLNAYADAMGQIFEEQAAAGERIQRGLVILQGRQAGHAAFDQMQATQPQSPVVTPPPEQDGIRRPLSERLYENEPTIDGAMSDFSDDLLDHLDTIRSDATVLTQRAQDLSC